jgi:hypothetical protein
LKLGSALNLNQNPIFEMASRSYRFFNGRIRVLSNNPSNPIGKGQPFVEENMKIRSFAKKAGFFLDLLT